MSDSILHSLVHSSPWHFRGISCVSLQKKNKKRNIQLKMIINQSIFPVSTAISILSFKKWNNIVEIRFLIHFNCLINNLFICWPLCVCDFLHIQIKCLSLTIFVVVVVEIYLLTVNTLADNMRINVCLKSFGKVVCISRNQFFLYQLNLKLSINVYYKCVLFFSLFFCLLFIALSS